MLPRLAWVQNPNYRSDNTPPALLTNYGYAEIVGRQGLILDDAFALGLLLLGPHTEYPPHHHPAEEIYATLAGRVVWWQSGQPWVMRPPDTLVYHPSGVAHAMRTVDDPALLLYIWWGEVQTAARENGEDETGE
jgi:quercetin dioxygenase-like cupin family protein